MTKTKWAAVVAAGVLAITASAAIAQTNEQILKDRQTPMVALSDLLKEMKGVADANGDLAPFARRADTVAESLKGFTTKFPQGTGPDSGLKTCALAGVWSKPSDFEQGFATLTANLDQLRTDLRATDTAKMKSSYTLVTQSCSACHGRSAQIAKWPPC